MISFYSFIVRRAILTKVKIKNGFDQNVDFHSKITTKKCIQIFGRENGNNFTHIKELKISEFVNSAKEAETLDRINFQNCFWFFERNSKHHMYFYNQIIYWTTWLPKITLWWLLEPFRRSRIINSSLKIDTRDISKKFFLSCQSVDKLLRRHWYLVFRIILFGLSFQNLIFRMIFSKNPFLYCSKSAEVSEFMAGAAISIKMPCRVFFCFVVVNREARKVFIKTFKSHLFWNFLSEAVQEGLNWDY